MRDSSDPLDLLSDLLSRARRAGADSADAVMSEGVSVAVTQRFGKTEKLERAEGQDLGLRVFVGKRQAIVSSNDFSPAMLDELARRAVDMARLAPEDPHCGIAEPGQLARDWTAIDTADPVEPSAEHLIAQARAVEEAALAVSGVTNSEGGDAGWSSSVLAMAATNGFAGRSAVTRHSVSVSVLAGEGTGMERDYDWSTATHAEDLDDAALVGRRAGERAIERLNPRKAATCKVPVFFDRRVSSGLIGHMLGAISGPSIARGTSFLKDKLGQEIFNPGIEILEDPHRPRGLRSRPFDGEGLPTRARALIEKGVLTTWLMDLRSARQLGLAPTGHASRGTSSPPGPAPSNLHMVAGPLSVEELMADVDQGLLITDLMGMGVNGVTGDYSRGAAGFWIEKGKVAYPVSEITVAGNLKDMYRTLVPASDLEFRSGMDAPTVRVEGMTVAGT